jgi:hypothetical protein
MLSSGILRSVALVRTDVSEEHSASVSRVIRINELGKRRFLQEPHGVTSQKTAFFDGIYVHLLGMRENIK